MMDEKLPNRWTMVVAALVMQICLGVLYAYSVVRRPLTQELGYTLLASFFFCGVGMSIAGRWQDKAGPRKVGIVGGVLLAIGAAVAGAMYKDLTWLIIGYGVL